MNCLSLRATHCIEETELVDVAVESLCMLSVICWPWYCLVQEIHCTTVGTSACLEPRCVDAV